MALSVSLQGKENRIQLQACDLSRILFLKEHTYGCDIQSTTRYQQVSRCSSSDQPSVHSQRLPCLVSFPCIKCDIDRNRLFAALNLQADYWDIERNGGISVNRAGERHPVTWL